MTIGELVANLAKEVEQRETLDRSNAEKREAVRHCNLIEVRHIIRQVRRGDFGGALVSLQLVEEALANDQV